MTFIDSKAQRGGKSRIEGRTIVSSILGSYRFEYKKGEFFLIEPKGWEIPISKRRMLKLADWINMMKGA